MPLLRRTCGSDIGRVEWICTIRKINIENIELIVEKGWGVGSGYQPSLAVFVGIMWVGVNGVGIYITGNR